VTGAAEAAYTRLANLVDEEGVLLLAPDGTVDGSGNLFWNPEHAECGLGRGGPDDEAYLMGLIDEVSAVWNVDATRIYAFGHSNGGFMAYRLACEHADRFAAIASLAGAPAQDPADCAPNAPLSVLQIHGDLDDTVLYAGGTGVVDLVCPYPGAVETTSRWAVHDGCERTSSDAGVLDLDQLLIGPDTRIDRYDGCPAGVGVELWTIEGGAHIPAFRNDVHRTMWSFFSAYTRG
jgi:polyhydroxybutyrate depolymerase